MQSHTLDLLSVSIIGAIALCFIGRTYLKMRKNKCATICNGCSGSSCSTKTFESSSTRKIIPLKLIV